jgi:2'-5' RNA ligase
MILAYVVVLLFDRESEEKILKICSDICGHDSGAFMVDSCSKPHITIAICEEINEQTFYTGLESFAVSSDKFNLRFESIGIFNFKNITLFLSPVITDALINIHKKFYAFFTEDICNTPTEQYLPNKWVPHCTLAVDMTPGESITAIKSLIGNFQALDVQVEYIGIAEYSPDTDKPVIKTFELGEPAR